MTVPSIFIMPLRRVLLLMIALVLAANAVPAGMILDRRLEEVLVRRAHDELALAPRLLADRRAANGDAMMMHAKDLAHASGLGAVMARGDSSAARAIAERARSGYADEVVLTTERHGRWSGPVLPPAVLDSVRRGGMPVTVLADSASVRTVAVAPVFDGGRWVGAAGVAVDLNQAEAERMAGLTRADVLILGTGRVLAVTAPLRAAGISDAVSRVTADGLPHEIATRGQRYLVVMTRLDAGGRVAFVRDLGRELAVLRELRGIGALTAAIALVLTLVLGAVLANAVAAPVRGLARAADRLAAGDFDAPLHPSRVEEVDRLAAAFGAMRRALQARLRDLEDRQARLTSLQAQLIQRDRLAATGRLVVQLAHEIRNPVANIRNCLELIRRRQRPDAETRQYTDLAIGELLRMNGMAAQLLDLHRPRAHAAASCAPTAVAHEVAALLRIDTTDAAPVVLVRGTTDDNVGIAPDALKQVLLSLCHNAREAMHGTGAIEITIADLSSAVSIEVCDTGPGIPEAALPRVFDPFFTTKSAVHGVGLGLFVAEGIVRSHGGTIVASNREDAQGARFVMTLPHAGAAVADDAMNGASDLHATGAS